jgi:predicted DNA-binding transcriptional regulator AlpA
MPTEAETSIPLSHRIDRRAREVADRIAHGTDPDPDELLSTGELAELTGLSTQFFEIGRVRGYGPRFIKISPRKCRYRRSDVVAWLEERTHQRTTEYGVGENVGRPRGTKIVGGNGPGGRGGRAVLPAEQGA